MQADLLRPLRAEIDLVDDQHLALIERRLALSSRVARCKQAVASGELKFRPRRQEQLIERLQTSGSKCPAALVGAVWRELMSHGLQMQGRTELILCADAEERGLFEARVQRHFGSGAPIAWAAGPSDALSRARKDEAVAVLARRPSQLSPPLRVCDVIRAADGTIVAWAIGRVAAQNSASSIPDELPRRERHATTEWRPDSWRSRVSRQMPVYPDGAALQRVEQRLHRSAPLVAGPDIMLLRAHLARVAAGEAFLLQGGDCAEAFAEFSAEKVRGTYKLLLHMGALIRAAAEAEIVHVARIAGQFAKPRSCNTETVDGLTLPSYRGDAVNGAAFNWHDRTPQPGRLLNAHRQAQATIELIHAYAAASYADLPAIQPNVGLRDMARPIPMFTSHEALLLNYEQALARFDEQNECWWATSGHMIWIGDRTRELDGAHVEFARGVANPVGLKCGPSLQPDELIRLLDRLDPANCSGRMVLIGRFGAGHIATHLPGLMRACRREGRGPVWSVDPMHGNTRAVGGWKTRRVDDVLEETRLFFEIARAEGVHPGGVHLEVTGSDVTECLGGEPAVTEEALPSRYLTQCDPRLNGSQSLYVAATLASLVSRGMAAQ